MGYLWTFLLSAVIYGGLAYYNQRRQKTKIKPIYLGAGWIANTILWLWFYARWGFSFQSLLFWLTMSLLVMISLMDFQTQEIPNDFVLALYGLGIINMIYNYRSFFNFLLGGMVYFVLFLLIKLIFKFLGEGDIKLVGALGLLIGLSAWSSFLTRIFVFGVILGILLKLSNSMIDSWSNRNDFTKGEPFLFPLGPAISLSFLSIILFL